MSQFAAAFLSSFKADGIISEWLRHVRAKTDAAIFANFILECLRDAENGERRLRFNAFTTFISSRPWQEVAEVISTFVPEDDRELLATKEAADFFDRFRAIVVLQIQDYYRQFIQQTKDLPPVETPEVNLPKNEVMAIAEKITEEVVRRVRRELGEDWKSGGTEER
jgi:hypothetical protein